jgi:hypothetical protein
MTTCEPKTILVQAQHWKEAERSICMYIHQPGVPLSDVADLLGHSSLHTTKVNAIPAASACSIATCSRVLKCRLSENWLKNLSTCRPLVASREIDVVPIRSLCSLRCSQTNELNVLAGAGAPVTHGRVDEPSI